MTHFAMLVLGAIAGWPVHHRLRRTGLVRWLREWQPWRA
jgi:hypothetical protein